VHGLAQAVERLLVVLVGAVGEVEARDVHAGAEQLLDHGHGAGRGAERADDLGLGQAHVVAVQVREDARHVDVRHRASAPLALSLSIGDAAVVRKGGESEMGNSSCEISIRCSATASFILYTS
jgi:hypothetical protein